MTKLEIGLAVLLALLLGVSANNSSILGSAPTGLKTSVATTSIMAVTSTQSLIFATSTCDSRIISTRETPIYIGFSDKIGFVPTATAGHLQLASTTVAYDSGIYGCGALRVASEGNTTITVSETR